MVNMGFFFSFFWVASDRVGKPKNNFNAKKRKDKFSRWLRRMRPRKEGSNRALTDWWTTKSWVGKVNLHLHFLSTIFCFHLKGNFSLSSKVRTLWQLPPRYQIRFSKRTFDKLFINNLIIIRLYLFIKLNK